MTGCGRVGRTAEPPGGEPARPARDAPTSGRVTAIRPQEHDPERVSVFLDGVFAFGLGLDLSVAEALRVGDEVTAQRVAALKAADEVGRATSAALRLLARRPRSQREVRDRLRQKGFAWEAVEAALGKLEGWRYVDDEAFARYWVDNREAHKPRGRRLLEQELRTKGIDRETIRQAIDEAELDEIGAAIALARAKLRGYGALEPGVARRRLAGFLMRRGYGYDIVRLALEQVLGEADDPALEE